MQCVSNYIPPPSLQTSLNAPRRTTKELVGSAKLEKLSALLRKLLLSMRNGDRSSIIHIALSNWTPFKPVQCAWTEKQERCKSSSNQHILLGQDQYFLEGLYVIASVAFWISQDSSLIGKNNHDFLQAFSFWPNFYQRWQRCTAEFVKPAPSPRDHDSLGIDTFRQHASLKLLLVLTSLFNFWATFSKSIQTSTKALWSHAEQYSYKGDVPICLHEAYPYFLPSFLRSSFLPLEPWQSSSPLHDSLPEPVLGNKICEIQFQTRRGPQHHMTLKKL